MSTCTCSHLASLAETVSLPDVVDCLLEARSGGELLPVPSCAGCGAYGPRLHACLHCALYLCPAHLSLHRGTAPPPRPSDAARSGNPSYADGAAPPPRPSVAAKSGNPSYADPGAGGGGRPQQQRKRAPLALRRNRRSTAGDSSDPADQNGGGEGNTGVAGEVRMDNSINNDNTGSGNASEKVPVCVDHSVAVDVDLLAVHCAACGDYVGGERWAAARCGGVERYVARGRARLGVIAAGVSSATSNASSSNSTSSGSSSSSSSTSSSSSSSSSSFSACSAVSSAAVSVSGSSSLSSKSASVGTNAQASGRVGSVAGSYDMEIESGMSDTAGRGGGVARVSIDGASTSPSADGNIVNGANGNHNNNNNNNGSSSNNNNSNNNGDGDGIVFPPGTVPVVDLVLPRGLINMGSTCFMSCILQCLVHNLALRSFFVTGGHVVGECPRSRSGEGRCLACEFSLLVSQYLVGGSPGHTVATAPTAGALAPHRILYAMWTISGSLAGYEQQDAHEFLIAFLDAVHEHLMAAAGGGGAVPATVARVSPPAGRGMNHATAMESEKGSAGGGAHFSGQAPTVNSDDDTAINNGNGGDLGAGGDETNNNNNNNNNNSGSNNAVAPACTRSPDSCPCGVHRVFGGTMRSTVTCLSCRATTHTREPFFDVSLHLPGASLDDPTASFPLSECLDRFTSHETLGDKDNSFHCASCSAHVACSKRMVIERLPMTLCLHIKRFKSVGTKGTKLSNRVSFPVRGLELGDHLAESSPSLPLSAVHRECIYDLVAVIQHMGNLQNGHYVSFVLCDGRWYCCDDAGVYEVPLQAVQNSEAYLLFYSKRDLVVKAH